MVFHWSLSDNKSPQVYRTLLSILVCLNKKVGDRSRGRPEDSLFNSYYTEVSGKPPLLSLDCSTLPWIRTLFCWVLSKEVSSTIFKVFGVTRPGIEPRSPGQLANTLPFISLDSEWQQVSSNLPDSSQYSGHSQQCSMLDGLHLSSYFQVL